MRDRYMNPEQPTTHDGKNSTDYASLLNEPTEATKETNVTVELDKLIDEYIQKEVNSELSDGAMKYVQARVGAMREVLASVELKQGKSLSEIIDTRLQVLRDKAQKIKDSHGPLKGATYIEPDMDAASDLPKGSGRFESAENYPKEVGVELDDIYTQETALLSLREVMDEIVRIKNGTHVTWDKAGDLEGDARIGLVGKLGNNYGYPFSWHQ
jgi:hypothetical protein